MLYENGTYLGKDIGLMVEIPKDEPILGVLLVIRGGSSIKVFSEYPDLHEIIHQTLQPIKSQIKKPLDLILVRDWAIKKKLHYRWKIRPLKNPVLFFRTLPDSFIDML